MDYWFKKIKKPIIGLAPMHGITNSAFRLKCRLFGADLVYSEMVAAEAIIRQVPKALAILKFTKAERPIILQIFGSNPNSMAKAAKIVENDFAPDGIDINFGCPVQKAAKQGFGSIQLKDSQKARNIIIAVGQALKRTPLSFKMRIPSNDINSTLLFVKNTTAKFVKMVAIHGRTPQQLFRKTADWQHAYEVKKCWPNLLVLGNGDINSAQDLQEKLKNLDGVLVGRAAKRNSEIFCQL